MKTGAKLKGTGKPEKPKPAQGSDGRFIPGNSGGAGRPVGARCRLSESFLSAIAADFDRHGKEALERVRTGEPGVYLRIVASLVPRKLELEPIGPVESLSDAQLEAMIRQAAAEEDIPIPPRIQSKTSH